MGTVKTLLDLAGDRELLIIRVAEMAAVLRDARRADASVPVLCLLDCDPRQWVRWGDSDRCTNCGTPALPANTWHRLLVGPLRASAGAPAPRRAA